MKRIHAPLALAALFAITLAATGCGGNKSTNAGNTVPTNGFPYQGGMVQPLPGGAVAISFTGTNVYASGYTVCGKMSNFNPVPTYPYGNCLTYGYGATGSVQLAPVNMPVGQPGTIQKSSFYDANSGIAVMLTPVTSNPLVANISGIVTLSQQFVQSNFGGTVPPVLGVAFDLATTGSQIYGGTVWICTRQDSTGCHGAFLAL